VILLDTTVLNNFSQIQRPDLLQLVFPDAATTELVIQELEQGISLGYVPSSDWNWLDVVQLSRKERDNLARIRLILDDGEASCIAVALEQSAVLFSDDLLARSYARREGIRVSATLGVLVALISKGHLDTQEADRHLSEMVARGYRSPVHSLGDLELAES
jgi:predicted nucleic acid-binding protein